MDGTLINLCHKFANISSFEDINKASLKGNLANVDLTIQDITTEEIKTLPKDITASNFGKLTSTANSNDIILGIINLIFESIGMMTVFATINDSTKDIIIVGGLTKIKHINIVFEKIEKFCNVKLLVPENAEFATVIGALEHYLNNN